MKFRLEFRKSEMGVEFRSDGWTSILECMLDFKFKFRLEFSILEFGLELRLEVRLELRLEFGLSMHWHTGI